MTNTNSDNDKVLPATKTPARYQESSIRFRDAWLEYVEKEELVKFEIVNMIKILEAEGYIRTQAIEKIVNDHNDLRGFSRRTIYRELPNDMKRSYDNDSRKEFYNKVSNVPNDTFNEDLQNNEKKVVNITDSYAIKEAETVRDTIDDNYYMEDENIENVEDSNNYNTQVKTHIQQQISNPIHNDMLQWYERKNTIEELEQKTDLSSEKIDGLIGWHLEMIINEYRKLWIEINRMVRKLHKEYPEWKLDRIIYSIYEDHEETKNYIPFNPTEIKKHLDTENKELFGIFKKDKPIQNMKSIEDMR